MVFVPIQRDSALRRFQIVLGQLRSGRSGVPKVNLTKSQRVGCERRKVTLNPMDRQAAREGFPVQPFLFDVMIENRFSEAAAVKITRANEENQAGHVRDHLRDMI
jgi:hypothetical protein